MGTAIDAREPETPAAIHDALGRGLIVEEASFKGAWNEPAIQLLEYTEGEAAGSWSVRFASYGHGGQFQRQPLMLDEEGIAALREALKGNPRLREILTRLVE